MNLIKLALEEAEKDFKKLIDVKHINVNLIEITDDKKNITKDTDVFLYVNKKNTEIYVQTDKLYKKIMNINSYSDKFSFIKKALIHELTHIYEEDVIKKHPKEIHKINTILKNSPNGKNLSKKYKERLKSELLAELIANNYENLIKKNSLIKI